MGAHSSAKHYFRLLQEHGIPRLHLSDEQKKEVREIWGTKNVNTDTHELVLSVTGEYSPYICPELLFRTEIELALNDFQLKWAWSDKNYFNLFLPEIPMPKTLIRNVNGVFLDEDYRPVDADRWKKFLEGEESVIVKPALEGGGCGRGVKLISAEEFDSIPQWYRKNYIVQRVFRQHASLAALNSSSVNVVRVISLSLNGKVSPVNYALRFGGEGAVTDNQVTPDGRGMCIVGVHPDGRLKDWGVYSCGEKVAKTPKGEAFSQTVLPHFSKALEMTTRIHEKLPHFGFIGFDVCFAEDGEPTIMEFNIKGPGVLYYQYVNGPLFGDRTQEVIDTVLKR